ncbi:MAG: tetratricopeptide repeat protein [Verrucomicrobiales bacterium]|nr:tetratricopeptide repeat protein [Verrucomicrobiales bacterium]
MTPPNRLPSYRRFSIVISCLIFTAPLLPRSADAQTQPAVEDVLSYADLLFSRDQFSLAAQQYQIFIQENPKSQNLQIAWFRLGECYLKVDQVEDATASFNFLIQQFKRGPFVGSAAYRLAVLRFNAKDYRNSLAYFKVAKDELTNEDAKLQARFYFARSLQLTQQPKEALAEFEGIIEAKPAAENPFYERGKLESARLAFELGETGKALEQFKELAKTATTKEFKEEAIVRGGLLAAEAGQTEESEALLNEALRFSDTSPWKNLAQVGAIFNAFTREDYDRVIGLYNTGAYSAPDESRAKMLLVVGHSFRLKGDLDSASRLYALVEGKYPEKTEGIEAGYRRLQILHQQSDPLLPEVATRFAETQRRVDPDSIYIDMAWLMKAEWHFIQAENSASGLGSDFAKKHFGDAADAYKKVRLDNVDEKYRETALYKLGWSEIESGNLQDGILSLSRFIQRHPKSTFASSALAKRAMAYQSQGDHQFALGDYQSIASRYPDAPELEFALQQIALIFAHQRKTTEMIDAYGALLKAFPETDGAGEAYYWIGVGHFDLEQHQQAIPNLEKGRELDSNLEDQATLRLVICHYQLENIEKLAVESKRYLAGEPESANDDAPQKRAQIPPPVLEYLGKKLASEKDYEGADYFLTSISTPDAPANTAASTWKLIAECRQHLKKHLEAIAAFDHFLLQTERPSERANAYLARGVSQFCLRDFEKARDSAQESLRSQKEGRTNAEARLLLGDIGAANGNLEEAAREYLVVSQIFTDPEVTPKALAKAINAYQSLGNRDKAQELQNELSNQFPTYSIPSSFDQDC